MSERQVFRGFVGGPAAHFFGGPSTRSVGREAQTSLLISRKSHIHSM